MKATGRPASGGGRRFHSPRSVLVVVVGVVSLATAACGSSASPRPPTGSLRSGTTTTSAAAPSTAAATGQPVPGPLAAQRSTTPLRLQPQRIAIPAIGVAAAMTDLGIAGDGSIEVPSVPSQVGWLDTTPAPGQRGPAVVAGHVDSDTGPAVFYRLRTLSVGDAVVVTRRDGSKVHFTVDGVRLYRQRSFPTREVYGPVPGPALRLITCGGDYLKAEGGYQSNVVVYAS